MRERAIVRSFVENLQFFMPRRLTYTLRIFTGFVQSHQESIKFTFHTINLIHNLLFAIFSFFAFVNFFFPLKDFFFQISTFITFKHHTTRRELTEVLSQSLIFHTITRQRTMKMKDFQHGAPRPTEREERKNTTRQRN